MVIFNWERVRRIGMSLEESECKNELQSEKKWGNQYFLH